MRGYINLPVLWGSTFRLYGGPYMRIPNGMVGVKMAVEIKLPCEVDIPTVDYSVPRPSVMSKGLEETLEYIISGAPVYAGCMGGIGRTGLLLALVAKAWGIPDPIKYVRDNYFAHAVETKQQMDYVNSFEISKAAQRLVRYGKIKNLFRVKKLLTNYPA